FFPGFGDTDGEVPGIGCAGFVAAEFTSSFVHWPVESVAVDGGGAGIQPGVRRMRESGDDLIEEAGAEDAGVEDFAAVLPVIAAVDAAAGEVDAEVGAFE